MHTIQTGEVLEACEKYLVSGQRKREQLGEESAAKTEMIKCKQTTLPVSR